MENKSWFTFRIGLFFVVLFWFILTLYKLGTVIVNGIFVPFTDVPASIGLAFRAAASLFALSIAVDYLRKNSSYPKIPLLSLKLIILFEAVYWLLFLPSGLWGFQYSTILYSREFFIIEAGLPCTVAATVIPATLAILLFKLHMKKPSPEIINWALITATAYLLVFWFNYTSQWWSEIFISGLNFLIQSRLLIFEFVLTVIGLLLIAMFVAIYAKESSKLNSLSKLNLKKAGVIITFFGLYFDIILFLWILFPDAGRGLTVWPTFSVEHNPDLWMASLPLIGIPLSIYSKNKKELDKEKEEPL